MKKKGLALLLSFLCLSGINAVIPVPSDWSCSVCWHVNDNSKSSCEYCGHSK